jgi:hypothetical protein
MEVHRRAIKAKKLVYIVCQDRPYKYPEHRSCVIYIGMTKHGVSRIAQSMSSKAKDHLESWGVQSLRVFVVTCRAQAGTPTWVHLERDLLRLFKREYGQVPFANQSGRNYKTRDLSGYFKESRLVRILRDYERPA